MVNYNTAYSKAAYKYFLKVFYNKTNKKEYKSQIWQYNIRNTNIIAMKNIIILEKAREKEKLSEDTANTTALVEVAKALSIIDLAWRYKWVISNTNMDAVKELELTGVKKYCRRASQVKIELD